MVVFTQTIISNKIHQKVIFNEIFTFFLLCFKKFKYFYINYSFSKIKLATLKFALKKLKEK